MAQFEDYNEEQQSKPLDSQLSGFEPASFARDKALRDFDSKLAEVVRAKQALENNPDNPELIKVVDKSRKWIRKNSKWLDDPQFIDDLFDTIGIVSKSAELLIEMTDPQTKMGDSETNSKTETSVTTQPPQAQPTFTLGNAKGAENLSKVEVTIPRLELDSLEPLESPEKPSILPKDSSEDTTLPELAEAEKDGPVLIDEDDPAKLQLEVRDFGERKVVSRENLEELLQGDILLQYHRGESGDKQLRIEDVWRVISKHPDTEELILGKPVTDEEEIRLVLTNYFKTITRKTGEWEEMSDEEIAKRITLSSSYEVPGMALNTTDAFSYPYLASEGLVRVSAFDEKTLKNSLLASTTTKLGGGFKSTLERELRKLAEATRSGDELRGEISQEELDAIRKTLTLLDQHAERIHTFLDPQWKGQVAYSVEKQAELERTKPEEENTAIIEKTQNLASRLWKMITHVEGKQEPPTITKLESLRSDDIGSQALDERREYLKQLEDTEDKEQWEVLEGKIAQTTKRWLRKGAEWLTQRKGELDKKIRLSKAEQGLIRLAIRELQPSVVDQIEQELDAIYRTYYQKSEWETFEDKSILKNPIVKIKGLNRKFLQWQYNRGLQQAYENDLKQALIEAYLSQVGEVAGALTKDKFDQVTAELVAQKETGGRGVELANQISSLLRTKNQKERELAEMIAGRPELGMDPSELRNDIDLLKKRLLEYSQNPDYLMAVRLRSIRLKTQEQLAKDPAKVSELLGELEGMGLIPDTAIDILVRETETLRGRFLTTKRSQLTREFGRYLSLQLIASLNRELAGNEEIGNGYLNTVDSQRDAYIFQQIAESMFRQWWSRLGLRSAETELSQSSNATGRTSIQRELTQKTRWISDIERITKGRRKEIESIDTSLEKLTNELEATIADRSFGVTSLENIHDSGTLVWNKHLYDLRKRLSDKQQNYKQELAQWRQEEAKTAERIRSFIPTDWEEVSERWKQDRRKYGALLKKVENYQRWLDNYDQIQMGDPLEQTMQFGQDIDKLEEIHRQRENWIELNAQRWQKELESIFKDEENPELAEELTQLALSGSWTESNPKWIEAIDKVSTREKNFDLAVKAGQAMVALRSIGLFAGNVPDLADLNLRGIASRYRASGKSLELRFKFTSKMAKSVATGAILLGLVGARFTQENQPTMGEFVPSRPTVAERAGVETRNDVVSGFEVRAPISNSAFATESAGLSPEPSNFELVGSRSIEDPDFEPVVINGTPEMYERRIDRLEAQLNPVEKGQVKQIEDLYRLYNQEVEKVEDLEDTDRAENFLNEIQVTLDKLGTNAKAVASYHTTGTAMSLPVFLSEQKSRLDTFRNILRIYEEGAA